MTADRELDRTLGAWFEERATISAPSGLLDRSLAGVEATRQRPAWAVADRWHSAARGRTAGRLPVGIGAGAALLVLLVAVVFFRPGAGPSIGAEATPSTPAGPDRPSPSPSPQPSLCSDGPCLGLVSPGTYTSKQFLPTVRYTVPAGWDNVTDIRGELDLFAVGGGTATYPDGSQFHDAISIFRRPSAESATSRAPLAGVGSSATDLAKWLDKHVDLDATDLTAVTINGMNGFRIAIAIPNGPRTSPDHCTTDHGEPRCESLFLSDDPAATYGFGIVGPETAIVYFLDTPSGDTVMVVIDDVDGFERDALISAATPIVNSLVFSP
jgi:hypothetical protein